MTAKFADVISDAAKRPEVVGQWASKHLRRFLALACEPEMIVIAPWPGERYAKMCELISIHAANIVCHQGIIDQFYFCVCQAPKRHECF